MSLRWSLKLQEEKRLNELLEFGSECEVVGELVVKVHVYLSLKMVSDVE